MHEKVDMRSVVFKFTMVVASLIVSGVSATVVGQKKSSLFWDPPPATIHRVQKPDRRPSRPLPAKETGTFLTLQWHLLKRLNGNREVETDSSKEFETGDQLKLAITTNQNGYLYLISLPPGKDGVMLFPDLRINNGGNYVLKDKEYTVPSYCRNVESLLDPKDCWLRMDPPAGTETIIVIFSRDRVTTLPNQIAKPYAPVKRDVVEQFIASSQQKFQQTTGELKIPGQRTVRYATRVQNTNLQDNEELIATIELTHGE